jgi:hypothetical protein
MPKIEIINPARIAGDVFDVEDIIGKTLFPRVMVDVYNNTPGSGGTKIGTVASGNPAGVVYSWVTDKVSKKLWWQFIDSSNGKFYYIEHVTGRFDISNLKQQGVLTTAQKVEEQKKKEQAQAEDDKPWYEKVGSGIDSTVKTGLWILGGVLVVTSILKR